MTEYCCSNCLKNFGNKKDHWERHKNRTNPCKFKFQTPPKELQYAPESMKQLQNAPICIEINQNNIQLNQELLKNQCGFCKKIFSKKFNLSRHLDGRCKEQLKQLSIKSSQSNYTCLSKSDNNNDKIDLILKQNEELKKEIEELKKDNKIMKTQFNEKKAKSNININNIIVNNTINFNDVNYNNVDKKLFSIPIMNPKLYGKEIILKMIENIYINENLPE